jgi:hypothetical protein
MIKIKNKNISLEEKKRSKTSNPFKPGLISKNHIL